MNIPALIQSMQDQGLQPEQIVAILKGYNEEPQVSARQARNQRYYEKRASEKRLKASETSYKEKAPLNPPSMVSHTLPFSPLISPQKKVIKSAREKNYPPEFEKFHELYPPNSGSKAKAHESWQKAINSGVEHERISSRASEYRAYVERSGELTAHAATWLNQERWEIEYSKLGGNPRQHGGNNQNTANRGTKTIDDQLQAISNRLRAKAEAAGIGGGLGGAGQGGENLGLLLENSPPLRQET